MTEIHKIAPSITIEQYNDSQKAIWDEFIRASKNGTFLFLRDYMDYHRDRFHDHSLLIRDQKDKLIAVVPASKQGNLLVSHGGLTYGGIVTTDSMKTPNLLEIFDTTLTYLKQLAFKRFIYKTIPYIYHQIPAEEDRYALFLCHAQIVRRGVLTVIDAQNRLPFQERRLRMVKKAIKNNLEVRQSYDFAAYWDLLTHRLLETYNTYPVHSLEEITLLQSRLPEHIKLFACFEGATILAGVVIYESDKVAHTQYIASSEQGKQLGALDLIFSFLTDEVYNHKPFFDFGTSDEHDGFYLNRGLIEQKEGFGARVVVHDHYSIDLSRWEQGQIKRVMD
jgi:hypothetical protein